LNKDAAVVRARVNVAEGLNMQIWNVLWKILVRIRSHWLRIVIEAPEPQEVVECQEARLIGPNSPCLANGQEGFGFFVEPGFGSPVDISEFGEILAYEARYCHGVGPAKSFEGVYEARGIAVGAPDGDNDWKGAVEVGWGVSRTEDRAAKVRRGEVLVVVQEG
jgi:hypothetical protein